MSLFSMIRKAVLRMRVPLCLAALTGLVLVEVFAISIIGWALALIVAGSMIFGLCLPLFLLGVSLDLGADRGRVPQKLADRASKGITCVAPIVSTIATLVLLSRASGVPGAAWAEGLFWLSETLAPNLQLLAVIGALGAAGYHLVRKGGEA